MKKIFFLLVFHLIVFSSYSQINVDTVFITHTKATYMQFPKDVEFIEIPTPYNEEYMSNADGKNIYVRAKHKLTNPTTFTAKVGDDFYIGVLVFKEVLSPKETVRDFRNYEQIVTEIKTTKVETKLSSEKKAPEPIDSMKFIFKDHLELIKADGNKYKTVGIIHDNIYIGLSSMRHDENATYVKLKLSNSSNVAYLIDFASFDVTENKSIQRNEIKQYMEEVPRAIAAKESSFLYFVLPLVAIPEHTELKVTIREKGGLRTATLFIPAKTIASAQTF